MSSTIIKPSAQGNGDADWVRLAVELQYHGGRSLQLKAAIDKLVACINNESKTNQCRIEYRDVAVDLVLAYHDLNARKDLPDYLIETIQRQTDHINAKQNSRISVGNFHEDSNTDCIIHYRRILSCFRRLVMHERLDEHSGQGWRNEFLRPSWSLGPALQASHNLIGLNASRPDTHTHTYAPGVGKTSFAHNIPDKPDVAEGALIDMVSCGSMTAQQMFRCLVSHGCKDLSSDLDAGQQSSLAINGGGFADIFKGKLKDSTSVALKVLRPNAMIDDPEPKDLKRAMRETYNWSRVNHENVHRLMGVTMFRGRLAMVSQWMDHGNLSEHVKKRQNIDRYQLCVQVAAGVSYLHSINMVHGDLKACNILVSSGGVAKVSDFDRSLCLLNGTLVFSTTTSPNGGTLRWMAPELGDETEESEDDSPLDKRTTQSDVYALGMTMLETLTGRLPYCEYRNDHSIHRAISKKKLPARPKEVTGNERSDQMWSLLVSCWGHDPTARPTASEVLQSLHSLS